MHERILRAIAENPGAGKSAIYRAACIRNAHGAQTLAELESAGRVVNRGAPGLGRYYLAGSNAGPSAGASVSGRTDTAPADMGHAQPVGDPRGLGADGGGEDGAVADLLRITRRKPLPLAALCDALDLSPSRVRALIASAQQQGYRVEVAGDSVGWHEPEPDLDAEQDLGVAPTTGERHTIAVISDTHFGSKYCLRRYVQEFVRYAYDRGARHVLHAGDILDGCYDHGRWELSHHGFDDQAQDAAETLPRLPGLRYFAITGNHDETFTKSTGLDTGRAIVDRFRAFGRDDLEHLGARGATAKLGGARIELWHPRKSGAYSLSYHLQNHIRDLALGRKPDILLAGHWHTWVYLEQRGVHALACGTFQGGGSAFGKSLGGAPSIGGTLVSWESTEHGTIRRVSVERSAYYEHEAPREIGGSVAAPPAVGWARCG